MGLQRMYLDYINENINSALGGLQGKRMLELGNQHIKDDSIPERTGKAYFSNRGVEHVSVDLNGLDGALRLDLSKPKQFTRWHNYFDIVTNAGTSEHVEPGSVQYECFMIIHDCLKAGGIAVHLFPDADALQREGCWKGHCGNYYSHAFLIMLSKNNNYTLVSLRKLNGLLCACLQKIEDRPFMDDRAEFLKYITRGKRGIISSALSNLRCNRFVSFVRKRLSKATGV